MKPIRLLKQYSKSAGVFFLGVLGSFFLFAFAYVVVTDPGDNLTLIESGVRSGANGERFLTGTLRNNTDDAYAFVQADLSLVDEEGSVVRETLVTARHLDAGETWRFEVPIRAIEATRAVLNGQCGGGTPFTTRSPSVPPNHSGQATEAAQDHAPVHIAPPITISQNHQIVLKHVTKRCRRFTPVTSTANLPQPEQKNGRAGQQSR